MSNSELSVGDTVRLNSGGPLMTVAVAMPDKQLSCFWFADSAVHQMTFPPDVLEEIKLGKDEPNPPKSGGDSGILQSA